MQLEFLEGEENYRAIGAAVVRTGGTDILLELGPADGPPHLRLRMSHRVAMRLCATMQSVAQGGDEAIFIVED